jgi:hypothetical protein
MAHAAPPPVPPVAERRADALCAVLRTVAAGAATGFVAVRGPAVRRTPAEEVFLARVVLPEAQGCSVFVPRGRGAAAYACTFSGGIDVGRAMGRLVRRSAHCVGVAVGNPPNLKPGPRFYFPSGVARFDFSAQPGPGRTWRVTLAVSKGPNQPRRPLV